MYVYRIDILKTKSVAAYGNSCDEPNLKPVNDGKIHFAKYFHSLDGLNKYLKEAEESLHTLADGDAKIAKLQYDDEWTTTHSDFDKAVEECGIIEENSFDDFSTTITIFATTIWCCYQGTAYWQIDYSITVERIATED